MPASFPEAAGRPEALAGFLQKEGLLQAPFVFSPADCGFAIDTARPKTICCDAVFIEFLRSHLTADQVTALAPLSAGRAPLAADSGQAVLYAPFTTGALLFVLVENPAPGSRAASLVVLKSEGGHFTVVEKSPLCRARRSAARTCGK